MAQFNFDASQVAPNTGTLEPLPDGWYCVTIMESAIEPTADGNNGRLRLDMEITDGASKGRKIRDNLNLFHSNSQTVEIAYGQLSAYCHATGIIRFTDTHQLHGIPFAIRVITRTDPTGQYGPQNSVKAIKPLNDPAVKLNSPTSSTSFNSPPSPAQGWGASQSTSPAWAPPGVNSQPATTPSWAPPQPQPQPQQPAAGATPPWMQQTTAPQPAQDKGGPATNPTPPWMQQQN